MRVVIRPDADSATEHIAEYVSKRIADFAPSGTRLFVLGLPVCDSLGPLYKRLVELHRQGRFSFEHVVTFNMEEYVGLPEGHPQSCRSYMWHNLFKYTNIRPENAFFLNGNADVLDLVCRKYEETIAHFGGIELLLTGIGVDGQMAFNEPGSSLASRTRVKTLSYETIMAHAPSFNNDVSRVPKLALTMGVGTIMDAREVVAIVTGAQKAPALAKCIEEGASHMWTASVLQHHQTAMIVCDEDATLDLRVRTVRYFKSIQTVLSMLRDEQDRGRR